MRSGVRFGRLFGINLYIDWSWLFIFLLVTWSLGAGFAQLHSEWGTAMRWGLAVIAAILFFASVLAHELAHSLVAKAHGMDVRSITLFLFGGIANIQRDPPSARAEFLIAIVGPITSIVIGALLVIAGLAITGPITSTQPQALAAQLNPLTTLLLMLGPLNIVLGIFNMLPGFPLDGGRVLRSILWKTLGDLRRATRYASWVGQGFAWLLILSGIAMVFGVQIPFFGTGVLNGLWIAFIGWFLNTAAVQSYEQVVIQDILEGVPVERMMRGDVSTVPPDISISSLTYDYVMRTDERAFPVMESDRVIGLATLDDIRGVDRERWDSTTVRDIMTAIDKLAITGPQEDAADVLQMLSQRDVGQLPVMENGRLVGLVRRRDIMRWLQLHSDMSAS